MKISIRVSNTEQLKDAIKLKPNYIGIGSEYCVYKVPEYEVLSMMLDQIDKNGIKPEILTPFVPETHVPRIMDLIISLNERGTPFDLTINDLGLLKLISEKVENRCFDMYIGHVYSTSFENCPWHEKVLSEESEEIKEGWCQNNFVNDLLLEHMCSMGISGVELEMLPVMLNKSTKYFRNKNIKIKGMLDYIPSAITRACHIARYYDKKPSFECTSYCDKVLNARFTHRYIPDNTEEPYEVVNEELIRPVTPDYLIIGNAIYCKREVDINEKNINNVDSITFDMRAFSIEELEKRINRLKEIDRKCEGKEVVSI